MRKISKLLSKSAKNGFYIILFLCICAIGISGYVMFRTPNTQDVPKSFSESLSSFELPFPEDPLAGLDAQDAVLSEPLEIPDQVVMADAEPDARPAEEKPVKKAEKPAEKPAPPRASGYVLPLEGEVSMAFSGDELVKSKTMGDWRVHSGVDIAAEAGAKVYAVGDGKVRDVFEDEMMGHTLVIDHGNGCISTYSNLMKGITVKKGENVEAGQVIGGVGTSAIAECLEPPHLHLEISVNGAPADPMEYIREHSKK